MNIKALAEKIKKIGDREKARYIRWTPNNSYRLATALLKVLEDGDRLYKELKEVVSATDRLNSLGFEMTAVVGGVRRRTSINLDEDRKALESHEKLMEELGGD